MIDLAPSIETAAPKVRLDLGAGQNPREGFIAVDAVKVPGYDNIVQNLLDFPYQWDTSTVDEVHMSHVLEHFTRWERVRVLNEVWRILKPGGTALIITPRDDRHDQDPTHKEGQVVEAFYYYLNREWRESQRLTHNDYEKIKANFVCPPIFNYSLHPDVVPRSDDYRRFAAQFQKNAVMDLYATLTAIKP